MIGLWNSKHVADAKIDEEMSATEEERALEELENQQITRMNALISDLVERQNEVLSQLQERAMARQKKVALPKVELGDGIGAVAIDAEKAIAERMNKIEKYIDSVTPNSSVSNEL